MLCRRRLFLIDHGRFHRCFVRSRYVKRPWRAGFGPVLSLARPESAESDQRLVLADFQTDRAPARAALGLWHETTSPSSSYAVGFTLLGFPIPVDHFARWGRARFVIQEYTSSNFFSVEGERRESQFLWTSLKIYNEPDETSTRNQNGKKS